MLTYFLIAALILILATASAYKLGQKKGAADMADFVCKSLELMMLMAKKGDKDDGSGHDTDI